MTAVAPQSSAAFLLVSLIVIQLQWKHIDCHLKAKPNKHQSHNSTEEVLGYFWAEVLKVLFRGCLCVLVVGFLGVQVAMNGKK